MPEAHPEDMDKIVAEVTEKVVSSMDKILLDTIQKEIADVLSQSLSRALKEGEFFRKVNDDMREGLEQIYSEIKKAKKGARKDIARTDETNELINKASNELDAILKSTEDATVRIMDIVEDHQERIIKSGELLQEFRTGGASKTSVNELIKMNDSHQQDLMNIMTALSFQDLTGQRIKKIVKALKKIEGIVFNVYMSTGLRVKKRDQQPELDEQQIEQDTQKTVAKLSKEKKKGTIKGSKLKGPQNNASQEDVDDLLSQLGL